MPSINKKAKTQKAFESAFRVALDGDGLVGTKMEKKVFDCILDYIPSARSHGLPYSPVVFGLKRLGDGMTIIACSQAIKEINTEGLQLNFEEYGTAEALMIAAEMNRIFEKIEKGL